jgi:hypothetical protein
MPSCAVAVTKSALAVRYELESPADGVTLRVLSYVPRREGPERQEIDVPIDAAETSGGPSLPPPTPGAVIRAVLGVGTNGGFKPLAVAWVYDASGPGFLLAFAPPGKEPQALRRISKPLFASARLRRVEPKSPGTQLAPAVTDPERCARSVSSSATFVRDRFVRPALRERHPGVAPRSRGNGAGPAGGDLSVTVTARAERATSGPAWRARRARAATRSPRCAASSRRAPPKPKRSSRDPASGAARGGRAERESRTD